MSDTGFDTGFGDRGRSAFEGSTAGEEEEEEGAGGGGGETPGGSGTVAPSLVHPNPVATVPVLRHEPASCLRVRLL